MGYDQYCQKDSDCYYLYHCSKNQCEHNEIWPPDAMQIIVTIILPFFIGIINVGGLGGGVVKVPIMMMLLNYQQKKAALIGYCITFGSGFPNAILLLLQKHPYLDRPLIDFNTVATLNTTVLLGSVIGSITNQVCPDIILTVLFICFLTFTTPYLWNKARNQWKEEKKFHSDSEAELNKANKVQLMEINQQPNENQTENQTEEDQEIKMINEEIKQRQKSIFVQANFLENAQDNVEINSRLRHFSRHASQFRTLSRLSNFRQSEFQKQNTLYQQSTIKSTDNDKKFTIVQENLEKEQISEVQSEIRNGSVDSNQQNNEVNNQHLSINSNESYVIENQSKENQNQEMEKNQTSLTQKETQQIQEYQKYMKQDTMLNEQKLQEIMNEESKIVPIKKFLIMLTQLLLFIAINLFRGESKVSIIGVKKCSSVYWVLTCLIPIISIIAGIVVIRMLLKEQKYKQQIGYEFDEKDLRFNKRTFGTLFGIGLVGGFLSGAVNAGASMAVLPVLLLIGMHPRVASATSGFNTAFMALTLITTVILSGELSPLDIITFTLIALIGGFFVSKIIYYLVNKYKKQSLVIFSVFFISLLINVTNIMYIFKTESEYGWNSLTDAPKFC